MTVLYIHIFNSSQYFPLSVLSKRVVSSCTSMAVSLSSSSGLTLLKTSSSRSVEYFSKVPSSSIYPCLPYYITSSAVKNTCLPRFMIIIHLRSHICRSSFVLSPIVGFLCISIQKLGNSKVSQLKRYPLTFSHLLHSLIPRMLSDFKSLCKTCFGRRACRNVSALER